MSKSGRALFLALAGIFITITGYFYKIIYVNIPYQDAPKVLIQTRETDIIIGNIITYFGLFLFLLGLVWLVLQLFEKNDIPQSTWKE